MKNSNTYYTFGKLYVKTGKAKLYGFAISKGIAKACALALDDELETSTVMFVASKDEPIFLSALRQTWDSIEKATIYNDEEEEEEPILNHLWYSELYSLIREAEKKSPLKEETI